MTCVRLQGKLHQVTHRILACGKIISISLIYLFHFIVHSHGLICLERQQWQPSLVLHISQLEVMITIAYGNRMRDIGRSEQEYAVVNVLGMRRIIDFILTCNLEAFIRSYEDNAIISIFQMYETTVSAHLQLLETRTGIEVLVKPIVACSGCHCQSFSNLSFLTRMYMHPL